MNLKSFGRLEYFHPRGSVTAMTSIKTKVLNHNDWSRLLGAGEGGLIH